MGRLSPEALEQSVITGDGARLHVEHAGASTDARAPVVLLHGGMGTLDDWASLVRLLGRRRVVATDARGHGASTLGRTPLTYRQLQHDVVSVLDQLQIPRAVVVGFSDGGIVGYRLALHAAERVDSLVTIGGPNRLSDDAQFLLERVTASKSMWMDGSRSTGYPGNDVRSIRQPTLIVRGDEDHLVSLDEAIELRRSITNASLLHVPFAGHDPSAQVEIVAAGLRSFLDLH